MKEQLQELLNTLYEAQALVDLALRTPDDPAIKRLAIDKCYAAADYAASLDTPAAPAVATNTPAAAPDSAEAQAEAVPPSEPAGAEAEAEATGAEAEDAAVVEVFTAEVLPAAHAALQDPSIFAPDDPEAAPASPSRRPALSAFSVNDKFRAIRELFAGSAADFNSALARVETMADPQEAYEYFYNDLQWDPESPEVKDFLTIVERYLNS